eukprot:14052608-Alexandrium_andersonii.AAC.1
MAIYHHRHHVMVLTIVTVMVMRPRGVQTWSQELSRGPSCAAVRTEREYGSKKLSGAPEGSCRQG